MTKKELEKRVKELEAELKTQTELKDKLQTEMLEEASKVIQMGEFVREMRLKEQEHLALLDWMRKKISFLTKRLEQ